jgi:hypothetical protein
LTKKNRNRSGEWLQLLVYCEILSGVSDIKSYPVIYAVRKMSSPGFSGRLSIKSSAGEQELYDYSVIKDSFRTSLLQLIERIFSPSENFYMTSVGNRCSFCPYNRLCLKN